LIELSRKGSDIMDERIKDHLMLLNRYYLLLLDARKTTLDQFLKDEIRQASTERFLHLAIESCLNIGNRLLALYQFTKPVRTPETYADIFRELDRLGVVDRDFANRLIEMARFRNRLVHLYWEVDGETVYDILQKRLEDFVAFRDKVVEFLNAHPL
jgi:uncharacterized protein YutE (UPF0331/DUF86 family)